MSRDDDGVLAWAAIDFLCALLLIVYTLIAPPPAKPHVQTYGSYVVILTWPRASTSDLDLYVRDPAGRIVFFNSLTAGVMHLEHDDIPLDAGSGYGRGVNAERVILRGTAPGEFTVTVHVYQGSAPVRAHVVLWDLQGNDRLVTSRDLRMGVAGDEQAAFRFVLAADGSVRSVNHLPAQLVGLA